MILLAHMLLGAVIGAKVKSLPAAIILALLGHYLLDLVPHIEYSINNITSRNWKKSLPDFLKVFADFSAGMALITIFSNRDPVIYLCTAVALLPDFTTLLSLIFPNKILNGHDWWHTKIHFLENKKIPVFWRIFTQIATVTACVILLKY